MRELAEIQELVGRAGYYAALRFSTDTADPANGALMQWVQEQETAIQTTLLFFELEWAALARRARRGAARRRRASTSAATTCATCAATASTCSPSPRSGSSTEKSLTGASAWTRLFEELTSVIEVELPEAGRRQRRRRARGARPLDVALSRLQDADREVRRTSAEGVTAALAPGLRTRAYLFNTLLADKATDDRLRRYPHWLAARNLANEASDESVQALIAAVRARYEIPRRWYRLKARLLGRRPARRLRPHGLGQRGRGRRFPYAQAREIVLDCYSGFSPELGALARRFFDERRIDAPVRPGQARRRLLRRHGARPSSPTCCSTTPRGAATC